MRIVILLLPAPEKGRYRMATFNASKLMGAWAEEQVMQHYASAGTHVADVRDDKYFRSMDVDLVIDGNVFIEVKGDSHTTENIFIETISNVTKGTPGCLLYTAADYVFYYYIKKGVALVIPAKELKKWIKTNIHKYMEGKNDTHNAGGRVLYSSKGAPVPAVDIIAQVPGIVTITGLPVKEA